MEIVKNPRMVVWYVGNDNRFLYRALDILHQQFNGFDLIGVTATEKISAKNGAGREIPFLPLNEIAKDAGGGGLDIILVTGGKKVGMYGVIQLAREFNIDTKKLLGDWTVCIHGFTLEKYRKLQHSRLSIFAVDCFGGIISSKFGLPFRSPFINLWLDRQEFVKFLQHPRTYITEEPTFEKMFGTKEDNSGGYPVLSLGNISLYMMHYRKIDESIAKWNERKQRINWYNLFVVTNTEDPNIAEQFDALPYAKKVCFVPFESDLDSAFYINKNLFPEGTAFPTMVNAYASLNTPPYYDMFDMLLYGKKTQLVDM